MPNEKPNKTIQSGSNTAAKHNARRYALQAMYQWQLSDAPLIEIETDFLLHHIEKKLDLDYFKELLHNIPTQLDTVDDEIRPLIKRQFHEIDPIELAMLRIATYELKYKPEIPYRVIINEALELTKKFGSAEGFKFVNGVLDRLAKKIRPVEAAMKK